MIKLIHLERKITALFMLLNANRFCIADCDAELEKGSGSDAELSVPVNSSFC